MKVYTTTTVFAHPWDKVSLAIYNKYPNPFASHVLSADVIERSVDSNGVISTTRLFLKKNKIPEWGLRFLKVPEAYILETSVVDPRTKTMEIRTRNLSLRKIMLVEETQTIRPLGGKTQIVTNARFISNTSFFFARSQIEGFGLGRFKENAVNSAKGLNYILDTV